MTAVSVSVPVPQESSHRDELFMQQSLVFSDKLKDLKSLRKQLYSAAEYFEIAYGNQLQKQIVEETLKDYAIKALVNTVDHLGSVAYKINSFLDEKMSEYSGMELRLCCLEQRLKTCHDFVNLGDEAIPNDVANTRLKSHPTCRLAGLDLRRFKNIHHGFGVKAKPTAERVGLLMLRSPRPLPRQQRPQLFTSVSMNLRPENRSTSPRHFPLSRTGSPMSRSNSPNAKRRYPSEPRRTVSLSSVRERERGEDVEQYSTKSKRLFKAMLSLRKSKKDPPALYKFLDDN
ncbi:hypothetical protein V6N11_058619 [Hibiscus sabdariffa]|uniref:Uncharacterized protein n=1 Tax=Hibiscus sabdariffa TaxID=183260 RepID=A0ABR2U4S6_9ROSI